MSFGMGGEVQLPGYYSTIGRDLLLQSDGKLLVPNNREDISGDHVYPGLNRYNADGSPDTSFGDNGAVNIVHNNQSAAIGDIALDSAGRIVGLSDGLFRL